MPSRKKPTSRGGVQKGSEGISAASPAAGQRRSLRREIREPPSPSENTDKVGTSPSSNTRGRSSRANAPDLSSPNNTKARSRAKGSAAALRASELTAVPEVSSSKAARGKATIRGATGAEGNSFNNTPAELPTAYSRGRARRLPQRLDELLEEAEEPPSPGVAAAAGTLVYAKSYGKEDKDIEEIASSSEESEESDYVVPEGLAYSDDEDVLVIDIDSDDEAMKGFPRDNSKNKNYNRDGPQPPDLDRYPEHERQNVLDAYKKKRKVFNDLMRKKLAKLVREGIEGAANPFDFKGWNVEQLRTMDEVETNPLKAGHTFYSRDILYLRVAEEANHRGIVIRVNRSDDQLFVATGIDFYVRATFTDKTGWVVSTAVCREGGDVLKIPPQYRVTEPELTNRRAVTMPLKSRMIVPIILNAVGANPGIPYPFLRELLFAYAKPYALTDSILQEARDLAKRQLFGLAEENVQYAKGVEKELVELGHHVTVLYANRKEIIQSVCAVVLREELDRLKKLNQTMGHDEQVTFIQRWKKDNEVFLTEQFGMLDATNQKIFVKGVLFAPSTSTHIAPKLQDILQADGAHSQFGKYTLYQAYGTNANIHMSPFAFGLLFGNEDKPNWSIFWNFVKGLHPCLDASCKTFLTDQDKGCLSALEDTFELAGQFMCSFHRRQNIVKNCGRGKGKIPYSALWVYNMLTSCHNMDALETMKQKYYHILICTPQMHITCRN
jgi:hypothetical protein